MPPVDLDKAAAALPPWDFSVSIGGVTYATRPPTYGEEMRLRGKLTDVECIELVWSFFKAPGPPLADATRDIVLVFYKELQAYMFKRSATTLTRPLVKQIEKLRTASDKLRSAAAVAVKAAGSKGTGLYGSMN